MTSIRTDYRHLIGGVSQQPEAVRSEMQCQAQDDAYISAIDGLQKRQPSEHIKQITGASPALTEGNMRLPFVHWINRDSDEQYVLILNDPLTTNDKPIRAFTLKDIGGKKAGDELDIKANVPGLKDYLDPTDATADYARSLKAVTIADTTFVVNTTKQVTMDLSEITDAYVVDQRSNDPEVRYQSRSSRRWFLFQRFVNAMTKYAVRVNTRVNHPTNGILWFPQIKGDATADRDVRKLAATGHVKTFDGTDFGNPNGLAAHVPGYTPGGAGPLYSGKQIPTLQTQEVLTRLWSEDQAGTPTTSTTHFNGVIKATRTWETGFYTGGIQDTYARLVLSPLTDLIKVEQNLPPIKDGVMMLELRDDIDAWTKTGSLWTFDGTGLFRDGILATVEERGDDLNSLTAFSTEVQELSQLPLVCQDGHIVQITGTGEDRQGYYVKFEADDLDDDTPVGTTISDMLGKGQWKETMASLSQPRIEKRTMPIQIKRVMVGNDPTFEVDFVDWEDKKVGDDESDPQPSFVGKTINDIFLWRNRLGFLSDSRVIMSEADKYENFWRTTVQQVVDSDPIDLDAGHNRVADLQAAVPIDQEMILFSDRTQFAVQGDPLLTPKTASLAPTTNYETHRHVRPEVVGEGAFFSNQSASGRYSNIHFLAPANDVENRYRAFPSSEQIPRYILGTVEEMTASSTESVLVVRSTQERENDDMQDQHQLFVHKWVDRGGDRILSSWFRYRLGPQGKTRVMGVKFIDDDLYMLVHRASRVGGSTINLERMTFAPHLDVTDQGTISSTPSTFRALLDRRVTEEQCTVSYNTSTLSVDIVLPYQFSAETNTTDADYLIVSRAGTATGPEGEQFPFTAATTGGITTLSIRDSKNEILAAGQFRFFVGQKYNMHYQFTRPTLRQRDDRAGVSQMSAGHFQVKRGVLTYEDSGYLKMMVQPELHSDGVTPIVDFETTEYPIPNLEMGLGQTLIGNANIRSGTIEFYIMSDPRWIRLVIENDTPYPSNPKGLELISERTTTFRLSRQ